MSGTGIKTKVLDAMALGIPVISTAQGVSGMPVVDRENCYMARDAAGFADCLSEVERFPKRALQIGLNGRDMVQTHFHEDRLAERWQAMVDSAVGGVPRSVTISPARFMESSSLAATQTSTPGDFRSM